jgi:four helix bundle protein
MVADFRELPVYQLAFKSAMQIFRLSKKWPSEERYSLTDQIRRSSRSVCGNIAESWRKRRYQGSFVSKLSDADGEAAETLVWLDFAKECGYLTEDECGPLRSDYSHICARLVTMINQADTWCGT